MLVINQSSLPLFLHQFLIY